jgi:hypothetical protein
MVLDANIENRRRDVYDAKRRGRQPRDPSASRHSNPDLMRQLSADPMKAERRNQTYNGVWDGARRHHKVMVL